MFNVKSVTTRISVQAMDALLNNNHIQDYTDDGFVYVEEIGWLPVGDVLENLILSEEVNEEKTKGQEDQVRSTTS